MHSLFNNPSGLNVPKLISPKFNYTKNKHRENLKRVISYYRRSTFAVKSNHLLVRLIQSLPSRAFEEPQRYVDRIENITDSLTLAFRLTSPTSTGNSIYPGVFYGRDSEEIIIVTTERFDVEKAVENWEDLEPIRFLRHPKTSLNLNIPDGRSTSMETGPTVVTLNLPMLALQYALWRKREWIENTEAQKTVMQFVAAYPLVNSLGSQLDIAYFNMFCKIFNSEEIIESGDNHPFFLNARYQFTKEGISEIIYKYLKRKSSFSEMLEGIDGLDKRSLREIIELPKIPATRQVTWALVVARLPLIHLLLNWQNLTNSQRNKQELNKIKRSLLRMSSDRTLDNIVSRSYSNEIKTFIAKEIKPLI